jgi:hypothetical protein
LKPAAGPSGFSTQAPAAGVLVGVAVRVAVPAGTAVRVGVRVGVPVVAAVRVAVAGAVVRVAVAGIGVVQGACRRQLDGGWPSPLPPSPSAPPLR